MDGTLALIFAVFGFGNMFVEDCPTGCLARNDAPARLSFQAADLQFDGQGIGSEIYLGYDLPRSYGRFQPTIAASYSDLGDIWVGLGAKWRVVDPASAFFVESSFMPGYYAAQDGPDIGGHWHFRSALGLGYAFDNGSSLTLAYDHRSNGGLETLNPGVETLSIRYAITLR